MSFRRRSNRRASNDRSSAFAARESNILAPGIWSLQRRLDPFPPSLRRPLRYVQTFTVTTTTLISTFGTEQAFRLNSLYDPDLTGAGHQPYGFDQLAALYKLYRVHATRVSISALGAEYGSLIVGAAVTASNDTTTVSGFSISTVDERPGSIMLYPSYPNGGTLISKATQRFPIAAVEGIPQRALDDDTQNYTANVGADPVRTPYLRIAVANPDATVTTYSCRIVVELEFDATFYERITQSAS